MHMNIDLGRPWHNRSHLIAGTSKSQLSNYKA